MTARSHSRTRRRIKKKAAKARALRRTVDRPRILRAARRV